jgi:DNA-3-methyladenine glycosylase
LDHSNPLPRQFYETDPGEAAEGLLGNILVRNLKAETLSGLIVETEAYYGSDDPASRARDGMKDYNRLMWDQPGLTFIYNVHKYWMLNIVAHEPNQVGAVLIRAIEPIDGIETMKKNRGIENVEELTNGPGKLTVALEIDNGLHGIPVTSYESGITIAENKTDFKVGSSNRIGVRKDLKKKLRFYIEGNTFVSK